MPYKTYQLNINPNLQIAVVGFPAVDTLQKLSFEFNFLRDTTD